MVLSYTEDIDCGDLTPALNALAAGDFCDLSKFELSLKQQRLSSVKNLSLLPEAQIYI